jgi:hypothetical protein
MTVHVYSQRARGDDAFVVGARDDLAKLRHALSRTLDAGVLPF